MYNDDDDNDYESRRHLEHIDAEIAKLIQLSIQRPGEVNGAVGKFFTFMRQIQGAVITAGIIGATVWAIDVGNRLGSIETKVDSPNYSLPGAVPKILYMAEISSLRTQIAELHVDVTNSDIQREQAIKRLEVEIDRLRQKFERKHP